MTKESYDEPFLEDIDIAESDAVEKRVMVTYVDEQKDDITCWN